MKLVIRNRFQVAASCKSGIAIHGGWFPSNYANNPFKMRSNRQIKKR